MAGKPRVSSREDRLTITTFRDLETKRLLQRESRPNAPGQQRTHLTDAGRRALAATFGQTQPTLRARTTATPAPTTTAARTR